MIMHDVELCYSLFTKFRAPIVLVLVLGETGRSFNTRKKRNTYEM